MDINDSVIIDAHAHCGIQDHSFDQSFESYLSYVRHTGIKCVAAFPPVAEIYDRHDFHFQDNSLWIDRRTNANQYLLTIGSNDLQVIPYFFIWNDFAIDQITPQHKGIKWHRHPSEPIYYYDSKECRRAIDVITEKNMPIVLEEAFSNTIKFINDYAPDARVIIPHLGGLNGGYNTIARAGLWENINVYTDTALASAHEIQNYIETYGHKRIMFGSDFPFGDPADELKKIVTLNLEKNVEKAVLSSNLIKLISDSNI
ncbi:amidohydrolase family protein [Desulfobacula sp.]|uniref:amidohydrolase family protein n=1 Tax=Desulfobacula sp. TaxID=2593537 RepID=UPI00262DA6C2|nr:amidohydrolase family protein [Desulfobacula sp.]